MSTCREVQAQQDACAFAVCGLRLEGGRILQGHAGEQVGEIGLVYSDLRILEAGPDSARAYAKSLRGHHARRIWIGLAGVALFSASTSAVPGRSADLSWAHVAGVIGASGLLAVAGRAGRRADQDLSRAVWFYNEAVSADGIPEDGPALPPLDPPHHGKAGAIIGSILGSAGGLAFSSRHSGVDVAEGILETVLGGVAGGFLGWSFGKKVSR